MCLKVSFELVRNANSAGFLAGNCKIAWDRLVSKSAQQIASSLLKLMSEFHSSKFKSIETAQVVLYRMAESKEVCCVVQPKTCHAHWQEIFLFFKKWLMGQSLQHHHASQK